MPSKSCNFAEKFGKMDRYDNFTIYFAELKLLAKWGQRITADDVSEDASNIMLLKNKSHDKIWLKNYREGKDKKVIATMDLAESSHASEAMKEYIKENMEIERALA